MPGQFRAAYDGAPSRAARCEPTRPRHGAVAALEPPGDRSRRGEAEWRRGPLPQARAGARGLSLGTGRTRQVGADGPVLRGRPVQPKRRVHFHVFMAEVHALVNAWRSGDPAARQARFGTHKGDDPDRADRRGDRPRRAAAGVRRVPGHRHRRRDDPRAAVRTAVRPRRHRDRHLQPRARRPLQGRPQPPALPAVHRDAEGADGGRAGGRRARLSAGPPARRRDLVLADRRRQRSRLRPAVARDAGRRCGDGRDAGGVRPASEHWPRAAGRHAARPLPEPLRRGAGARTTISPSPAASTPSSWRPCRGCAPRTAAPRGAWRR